MTGNRGESFATRQVHGADKRTTLNAVTNGKYMGAIVRILTDREKGTGSSWTPRPTRGARIRAIDPDPAITTARPVPTSTTDTTGPGDGPASTPGPALRPGDRRARGSAASGEGFRI